jgi:hypothetical protein
MDLLRGTAIMPERHHQTRRYPGDPFAIFELSRDLLLAQQKMMPTARTLERFSEAARSVSQVQINYYQALMAQMNYCQALMRANTMLLGAMLERPRPRSAAREQRPSVAVKRSEYTQA